MGPWGCRVPGVAWSWGAGRLPTCLRPVPDNQGVKPTCHPDLPVHETRRPVCLPDFWKLPSHTPNELNCRDTFQNSLYRLAGCPLPPSRNLAQRIALYACQLSLPTWSTDTPEWRHARPATCRHAFPTCVSTARQTNSMSLTCKTNLNYWLLFPIVRDQLA